MSENDKIPKVFLDTEVFQSLQFNFSNKLIEALKKLCDINVLRLYITSITDRENKKRIEKMIRALKKTVKKNKSAFYLLNSINETKGILSDMKIDEFKKELLSNYSIFKDDYLHVIDYSELNIGIVFDAYFGNSPPFNKEKKKQEFPDAFSILMVQKIINDGDYAIIVSEDRDIQDLLETFEFKQKITILNNLEELLNHFNSEKEFCAILTNFVKDGTLLKEINSSFDQIEFGAIGSFDPYIEDSSLNEVLKIHAINILRIEEEYIYFSFKVIMDVDFEIEATDPDSWSYDSEDKEVYYWGKETYHPTLECEVTFFIELELDRNGWNIISCAPEDFYEIYFEPGDDITYD